jgi:2',3'-cyclic-nucleotide 2'-phosphodiesterase/3'-nucleotidase/5'-nucleotidase
MYKSMKKFSALILSLVMVFSLFNGVQAEAANSDQAKVTILATSDIHGRFMPWEYATDSQYNYGSLARIATIVKEFRNANPNIILVDNGDTIQDNSNQLFLEDEIHPMILGMNILEYDTWTLGNHEFNYGVPVLEKIMKQFNGKVLAGNVYKADGSALAAPYTILEKGGVKIGIIGMTNPNITKWDAANLEGYTVTSPVEETKKAIAELKDQVDVMVAVSHVGPTEEYGNEDGANVIAEACPELAAIIAGHEHSAVAENRVNGVVISEPYRYGDNVTSLEITLTKGADGKYTIADRTTDAKTSLIEVKDYIVDEDFSAKLQPYHERAVEDAHVVIGKLEGGDLVPPEEVKGIPTAQIQETAMIKLINDVQRYYTGAEVSAAAAFSPTANIKEGDITRAGTSQIYKYDNTLYNVEVTGKQLKAYMEWSAAYYNTFEEGDLTISFNENIRSYNYDMFSGVKYDVDISKEPGSRIVNLTRMDGTPIKEDDVLTLAVNNYRYSSQLSVPGAIYEEGDLPKLLEKDVQNTAAVRDLIGRYIIEVKNGVIKPELENNWKVVGNNWDENLRAEAVRLINEGKVSLPTSADGRTPNVKSIKESDLIEQGLLSSTTDDNYKTIDILSINDFHGSLVQSGKNIGIANLVGEIKKAKEANPNTIFVGAGDLFQGSAESNLLYGKPVAEAMKEAGILVSAIGNHEYDWGIDKISQWAKDGGFEFLAANIYNKSTNQPVEYAKPYKIVEIDGIKIAFIGIATPETAYKTKPDIVADIEFKDPVEILPTYIDKVKSEGAQIVIALTHLGAAQDSKTGLITGEVEAVAKNVTGLDAIIAGHSHQTVAGTINNIPIVQAYYNGRSLGNLKFELDKTTNEVAAVTPSVIELYKNTEWAEDTTTKAILEKYSAEIKPILEEKIGVVNVEMIKEDDKGTLLGEWSADLMRKVAGTQIGIQNGGGLRSTIEKGDLTVGDMYVFMPFDNTLVTVNLTGAQLKAAIENGINNEELGIAFGQIAGVYVQYDLSKPFGERVIAMALENGDKIDMDKLYSVVTNDFMITGGDGYTVFTEGKDIKDLGIPIRDAMIEYVKKSGVVAPEFKEYQRTTELPFAEAVVTQPTTQPTNKILEYIVKPGDVLWKIAQKYGITYKLVGEYNKLKDFNAIYVGQKLLIPAN